MIDYKIIFVVDNVKTIYHCKSYFIKESIIVISRCFSRKCLTKIANSIYPDQTDHIGSVGSMSTLSESVLSTE